MRLAVFDLDGTVLAGDSHFLLLREILGGRGMPFYRRAEIVFGGLAWATGLLDNRWTKEVAARALSGRSTADWHADCADFCARRVLPLVRPGLRLHLRQLKAQGFAALLLSASLHEIVARVARELEFDFAAGTQLAARDGVLTGELAGEVLYATEKARFLRRFAAEHGVDLVQTRGYGDSYADLAFLSAIGEPVAVCPDRRLADLARQRGWQILSY